MLYIAIATRLQRYRHQSTHRYQEAADQVALRGAVLLNFMLILLGLLLAVVLAFVFMGAAYVKSGARRGEMYDEYPSRLPDHFPERREIVQQTLDLSPGSMRVPITGQPTTQREKLIAKLRRDLERFRAIPAERREAECADEGEATCLALLREQGADERPNRR